MDIRKDFYVYAYYEDIDTKPFYVGKGCGDRIDRHIYYLYEHNTLFYKRLRLLIESNISFRKEKIKENLTESEAFKLEEELIEKYGRIDIKTGCLCNHTDGGEGSFGYYPSEETRRLISCLQVGFKRSIETRLRMSAAQSKRGITPENRAAINKGIREKLGIPICSYDLRTGNIIKKYLCIRDVNADGYKHPNVRRVLSGLSRQSYGLGWRELLPSEIED